MYISEFGYNTVDIYAWTIIKTEEHVEQDACSYYEDCPCCTCDSDTVAIITLVRPRYSKSTKRVIEEYRTEWVCSAHADGIHW